MYLIVLYGLSAFLVYRDQIRTSAYEIVQKQALLNIKTVLEEAGSNLQNMVKVQNSSCGSLPVVAAERISAIYTSRIWQTMPQ